MALTAPECYRLTYEDWLECPDNGYLFEIIDGELIVSPPPSLRHQRTSSRLFLALHAHLTPGRRGEVFYAPVGVKLAEDVVPEPDLLVVLAEHADRVRDDAVFGPPDLVVEILSPGTAMRDLGVKRQRYEAYGVPECWIVDPKAGCIEVLALRDGAYVRAGLYGPGETLASPLLPGLAIPVSAVFA